MSILKRHSYDIVKLYIDQIGITVFSLILITALGSISDSTLLKFFLSVFTTLFFSVILYTTAWDLGAKDKLSLNSGRGEYKPYKGIVLSVFANIPNFVLAGLAAIFLAISKAGSEVCYTVGVTLLTIAKFTMAIYLGIVEAVTAFASDWGTSGAVVKSLGYFIVPIIAILVTQLGYTLGLKEKKLFGGKMDAKRK